MSDVYYDPQNGNDTTGAGTELSPWATGQKCLDNVLVAGGGGVIHAADTAADSIAAPLDWTAFAAANTTSADDPLEWVVWSPGGGSLVINHPYANYPCFEIDGNAEATIFSPTNRPEHVYLVNGKFHNVTATLIDAGNYWSALGCELYDGVTALWDAASYMLVAGCYFHTFGAATTAFSGSYSQFLGNYIDSPTSNAIALAGHNISVRGNIICNAAAHGIYITGNRHEIDGNTIIGDGTTSYAGIRVESASEQNICINNIIAYFTSAGYGVRVTAGGNFRLYGHNHFYSNNTNESGVVVLGQDLGNNQTTDPGFVDAAGGDFRIGTAGKAKGWPLGWPGSATLNFLDTGAVQAIMGRQMRMRT